MPNAQTIGNAYRVTAADLQDGEYLLTISAVSLQGLEEVEPVAHFQETRKRLTLSQAHCRTLILLTGSALFEDWVGVAVRVRVDNAAAPPVVQILPVRDSAGIFGRMRTWTHRISANLNRAGQSSSTPSLPPSDPQRPAVAGVDRQPATAEAARRQCWLPGLVITALSVVSFLYGRAYGQALLDALQGLFLGNGG